MSLARPGGSPSEGLAPAASLASTGQALRALENRAEWLKQVWEVQLAFPSNLDSIL